MGLEDEQVSTEKTAIEQADKIVGISEDMQANEITRAFNPDTYRRGAYVGWMSELKPDLNPAGFDLPRSIEDMAAAVVKFHAASQPKGDGLPEVNIIIFGRRNGVCVVDVVLLGEATHEQSLAMRDYLTRCLSAPVRRLMAEFEVVSEDPGNLWLVPKAVKR